jgi:hypothetical protein
MTGRSRDASVLNQVLWPDATLEYLAVDYDSVVLRVREATGQVRTIRCEGHIGYGLCGFWDEVIIERAEIAAEHPFIERCVSSISRRLGQGWIDSGNEQRNTRRWNALVVYLSDGSCLEIVAARFAVE